MGLFDDILEEEGMVEPPPQKQSAIRKGGLFDDILEEEGMLAEDQAQFDADYFRPKPLRTEKEKQEIGTIEGITNAAKNAFDSSRQAMDVVGGVSPEEAQNIAKIEFNKKSRKLAPGYDEYQKAEGWDAAFAFVKNPIEVTSNIIAEGLAGSLPALGAGLAAGGVGAAAGSVVPVLGTGAGFAAGQVAGTFAGSLATEYGSKVLEELQNEGMDISDPNSIQTFFGNEELVGKARDKALMRGVPVAAFDALSAGIGGKLGRVFGTKAITEGGKIIGKQFATKTGEALTELGVQAGLGAGGEVAGALAIGETPSVKAAFGEAIGEVGTGGIQVLTGRIADKRAMAKAQEDAKIKAAADLSTTLEENSSPLTASVVTAKSATNIEQDKLAAQLDEELSLTAVKPSVAAPVAIPTKDDYVARYSAIAQTAPEELTRAEQAFTNELATADTEEKRVNAQNALDAIKEVKTVGITPAAQPVTTVTQPPITDATQEIIQPEGVRQEPQDGTQIQTEEPSIGSGILDTARGEEEGQVDSTIFDLQSVANNTATREQISSLSLSGLVDIRKGQAIINEDGEGILAQAQAPLPTLTPEARAAEVEATTPRPLPTDVLPTETPGVEYGREAELFDVFGGVRRRPVDVTEPTIGEIPQTSPMIGEQPAEPIISEKPPTSDIVGAEPATIVEQEQVVPVSQEFKDELMMSGVAYDGDTRYSVQQSSDGTFRAERIANGQREDIQIGLPDIETAQNVIINSVGKEPTQVPVAAEQPVQGVTPEKPQGMSVEEGKAYLEERNKSTIFGYPTQDIMAMQQGKQVGRAIPSAAPAEAPAITPAPVAETPAVTPAAEPAGISVGNRIKLGKSPQTYTIEEVVPQSEVEKVNDEQFYSVKNERTGEVQVVEKADMKQVGGKKARKMAVGTSRQTLWSTPQQEISSAATSINQRQMPATFKKVKWESGTRNADIGGGRFDNATEYLAGSGVENVIYDPYNRSQESNQAAVGKISGGQSDTATVNNVLNVIAEPESRDLVIRQAADAIKQDGKAYFLIYEGDSKRVGSQTKAGWQENRKAESYISEIKKHFGNVTRKGNLIIAENPVKTEEPLRQSAEFKNEEIVTPIPEANRYTFEEAVKAVDAHFGKQGIPEGVVIVNNTTEPDLEMKAGYFVNRGQIVINLAYIAKGENLGDIIDHELGHYIFGDPEFQDNFKSFWEAMTPEEQAEADRLINQFYNKETGAVQMEEKQVRAFLQLIQDSKAMPRWKQLLDSIKRWINEKLGTNFQVTDEGALAVLAAAHKRFKSGEQIIREIDSGVLKMAAEPRREQVGGMNIGKAITTPPGITKMTQNVIKAKFFDSSTISDENTSKAFGYIQQLLDKKDNSGNKLAGFVNNIVDDELIAQTQAMVDSGKFTRKEVDFEKRMGASLLRVELMNYASRLAAQGNVKMFRLLRKKINNIPSDEYDSGLSAGARSLNTAKGYDISGYNTFKIEQESNVDRLAAALFGVSKPNEEQRNIAQQALEDSEDVEYDSAEDIAASIEKIEKRTKRNVVSKIEGQISGNIEGRRRTALERQKERPVTPSSVEKQAQSVIDGLANQLSDTPAFAEKQENLIKSIVQQDLRQKPRMNRKEAWTNQLTAKLIQAGASEAQAETISDLVWRQHEIKAMDRELKELQTAAEKGSLAVIIQRIKDTPLEEQQKPEWIQGVIREYLIEAGLSSQAADTAARLYESVIAERFAEAKQKAFEATLAKSAPWKNYLSRNAQLGKNALKRIQDAIRTGVLDPTQTTEGIIAKESGWSGFSKEQLTRIVQLDGVLSDDANNQVDKAEAMSELNKIIVKAKMPVRFRDAISAYYVAQALLGIPTFTVNIYSPTMFAIRNFAIDVAKYATTDPKMVPVAFQSFINSFKSLYDNSMYAFKNQIYMSGEIEYMQGQNILSELFDKGKAQWAKGDYANGMGNMLVGASQITGRILSSLDQGAIEMMQSQNITRYAIEAMSGNKKIPKDKRNEIVNIAITGRRKIKEDLIASGMASDRAGVLADLKVRSELMLSLSGFGIKEKDVLDAALNDALQTVGRNRAITINSLKQETKNLRDSGILSGIPIGFLEGVAQWANKGNQSQQVFAKMLYGFALVPARVFSTSLWFSPIGFVRLGVDAALKKQGIESRYAVSLATEFQQKQRFIEAIAGTVFWVGLGALVSASAGDEDDDKWFKIVVTGNGPDYNTDRQYHDSWHKKYKPHTSHIVMGKTVIPINIGRGGEAISIPLIFLGAGDDARIKEKLNQAKKSPADLEAAAEMIGSVFYSFSNRGPFSAFTKPLFDAKKQDKLASELFSQAGYFGKTFIPIVGTSLARNISDFINDPIDKSSVQGAIYSNMPIVGPMIGTKALNAFGQPIRADDWGDRLFKLGAPLAMSFPKNTPENELNELVLKKGDGPPIPTRTNAQKKFEDPLTDKEFETYVREYGRVVSEKMFKNRKRLESMEAKNYTKELDKYVNGYSIDGTTIPGASDMAVRAIKRSRGE